MANNSDSSHAKNVANLILLNGFNAGRGEAYNPANNLIKLPAMQELADIATGVQAVYVATIPSFGTAKAERVIAFKSLRGLVSRAMFFLKSSGASEEMYNQARTLARLMRGQRASAKIKPVPVAEGEEPVPVPKQISASHMGFDIRISNFGKFIQLLSGIQQYNPNEDELKIEALLGVRDDLTAKNNAYMLAEVPHSNTRIARNEVFYTKLTGLCAVGQASKDYVKSVYGVRSPQFKQISKIRFKTYK